MFNVKNLLKVGALFCLYFSVPKFSYAGQNLRDEWMDLWTRCRVSVETEQPIEETDLVLLETETETQENEIEYIFRSWQHKFGKFIVGENTWTRGASSIRACTVEPDPSQNSLSEEEIALLVNDFIVERERLRYAAGHEIRNNPQTYPLIILEFGLSVKNNKKNGCATSSYIFFDNTSSYFSSSSGDNVIIPPCNKLLR